MISAYYYKNKAAAKNFVDEAANLPANRAYNSEI